MHREARARADGESAPDLTTAPGLVPLGVLFAEDLRGVFDPARGRVAIAQVSSATAPAKWIGSAVLDADGALELGPQLVAFLRSRRISPHAARLQLLDALDVRQLRAPRGDGPAAPTTPLRAVRWCGHCGSRNHDEAAHVEPQAALQAARACVDAGDDNGARFWMSHRNVLITRGPAGRRRDA